MPPRSLDHDTILDLWNQGVDGGLIERAMGISRTTAIGVVVRARAKGDKRAKKRRFTGFCYRGHDLSVHGREKADGGHVCRQCKRERDVVTLRARRALMTDSEKVWPGLSALAKAGSLLVPTQISWRRATRIVKAGLATMYPFHQRWQGRVDITEAGRQRAVTSTEQP